MPRHHGTRRLAPPLALLTGLTLAVAGIPAIPASAADTPRTATIVGSLQNELGCAADWDPTCTDTALTQVPGTDTYQRTVTLPAGAYELKVAINNSWAENYGAGGAKDGANVPLVLKGEAELVISYDDVTHRIGITPTTLSSNKVTNTDRSLATRSLRDALTRERFYFVMADRFANGDTGNDNGGLTGGPLQTGFDPTHKGFYHGGDLKGLTDKLDYIKGMGTTAIWLTPSFKNRPVQGSGTNTSAGYHGYWITDFTQIDPHLGTNADMERLIAQAHAKGMKVFFDIITNHTADVIDYREGKYTYIPTSERPYKDAAGNVIDIKDYAGTGTFPAMDPSAGKSFPYTPFFHSDADANVKVPSWLNDPRLYHNRGDSTFAGESAEYGDFIGLDDLMTENQVVVDGMKDIYTPWVDMGIDGFRIDTVKHVNMEFWQDFSPSILDHAKNIGNDDFFMFGEVYDARPSFMSQYTTTGKLQSTLDFGFQQEATKFAKGDPTTVLRDLYADDDFYTDADSNAYQLPTFLGNHDMGRIAMLLKDGSANDADLLKRVKLADSLMYLTRGQPVNYYGDEQGFIGSGGDQDARQDMFPSKTQKYNDEPVLAGPSGSRDRFDPSHPLYQHLTSLAALRQAHPALADGAQIHRYSSRAAGIYAFSRIDARTKREYVVAVNNSTSAKSATFQTYNGNDTFRAVLGDGSVRSGKDTRITVTVPPLSARVWRSSSRIDANRAQPAIHFATPGSGGVVGDRAEIRAAVTANTYADVTFAYRPVGTSQWRALGTDDNAPYRVMHDVSGLADGTLLEYRALAKDIDGRISATSTYAVVGTPEASGGGDLGVGPVTQPSAVSVPGDHNSEMGCVTSSGAGEDWAPWCDQAQLALDARDGIWKGTFTLPAGEHGYKVATNRSWDENYGAGGVRNGPNISYRNPGTVSFYYDHRTHWVTSDAQGPIITAPGDFQSELGCGGDWDPACMRPWLQDPDGDGTYVWNTDEIPAGTWQFKVAHGLSWEESYGEGGGNVTVNVPRDGMVTTITYNAATHQIATRVKSATAVPDLGVNKATWVSPDVIAVPAEMVPAGSDPAQLQWRVYWGASGSLAVDTEAVTGGSVADLTYEPAGLPAAVVAARPELAGSVALRVPKTLSRQAGALARGQVALGVFDSTGRLLDATGVDASAVAGTKVTGKAA